MTPSSKTKAKTAPSAASVLVVVAPTAVMPPSVWPSSAGFFQGNFSLSYFPSPHPQRKLIGYDSPPRLTIFFTVVRHPSGILTSPAAAMQG